MKGRTLAEATAQLLGMGKSKAEAKRLAPHRVFVEAAVWNINAFDQWGVELGKEPAMGLQPVMEGKPSTEGQDRSTAGLVAHLRKLKTK
jgi:glucose-6-phosphate isomerase